MINRGYKILTTTAAALTVDCTNVSIVITIRVNRHRCCQSNYDGNYGETHSLYEVIWDIPREISNNNFKIACFYTILLLLCRQNSKFLPNDCGVVHLPVAEYCLEGKDVGFK